MATRRTTFLLLLMVLCTGVTSQQVLLNTTSTIGPALPTPPPSSNDTTSRVSDCKVAYTVGYGYRRLYFWEHSLVEKRANGGPASAVLNFRVRAFSDAHILLSTSPAPVDREPVYEIVLGAGRNTFSDIRRLRRSGTRATMSTPDILSPYELRGFWVRLSGDGTIEVGKEGDDTAFIGWRDPQPLPVRYFAFCTWTGTVGKWEYDCPQADQQNEESPEVEPVLTATQRLRRDLLGQYDPFARPASGLDRTTTVYLHLACQHISVDEKQSVITVHGTMSMHWMDEKLVWGPEMYDGLKTLHAASHEIWLPELLLYNAADGAGDSVFNSEATRLTVRSDGAVMWSPQARMQALCALTMAEWPRDRHSCVLRLGVWSHASLVTLELMENGTVLDQQHVGSRWLVEGLTARHVLESHPWLLPDTGDVPDEDYGGEDTSLASVFELAVEVRRQSSHYHALLITPMAAVVTNVAASFWLSPLEWSRGLLCCVNVLVMTFLKVTISWDLPITHTPTIMLVFDGALVCATITLLAHVLSVKLARPRGADPPPRLVVDLLSGVLGGLLLLPPADKGCGGAKLYDKLSESSPDEGCPDVASVSPSSSDHQQQWLRIATALDRAACLCYIIAMSVVVI